MGYLMVFATLAVAVITQYALITPAKFSAGPFVSQDSIVSLEGGYRYVGIFDRIRFLLGAYTIENGVWSVKAGTAWTCVFCLSFWVAIPFTTYVTSTYLLPAFEVFCLHFFFVATTVLYDRVLSDV